MPQCPTCGAQVEEEEDICPECGTDLTLAPVTPGGRAVEAAAEEVPGGSAEASEPAQPTAEEAPQPAPVSLVTTATPATLTLVRAGAPTSEAFNVGENVIIGRFDADTGPVDVDLGPLPESMYISRQHAQIRRDQEGKWMLRDLGSSNGTFVRSPESGKFEKIAEEREIRDGDEIALGNARFIFSAT